MEDKREIRNLVVIHNHPRNTQISGVDLRNFYDLENIFGIIVICNDGKIHMLRKEENFSKIGVHCVYQENKTGRKLDFSGVNAVFKKQRSLGITYRCSKR